MKLSDLETARICRELALLVRSGVSVAEGVLLLAREAPAAQKPALEAMGMSLDKGAPLSEAICHCGIFPDYAWRMVHIGEQTGRQEEALQNLAVFYEERCHTRRQLRSAVAYPSFVLILMLLVVGVLLVKVVPVFDRVYASLGSHLTGPGAVLLRLGQGLERRLPYLLILLAIPAAGIAVIRLFPSLGHRLRQRFGDRGIDRKFANARFARAMAMAMGSGLSLSQGLELACGLLEDSPKALRRCEACRQAVEAGQSLVEAAAENQLLPPAQCRMLLLALRSGNGDEVMDSIAGSLLREAQEALEDIITQVEPMMVLISSLLVGMILLSVMLPLMDILSVLG